MKKTVMILIAFIIASSLGCKGKNDVLVSFKDGDITRGEFYDWIDIRKFPKDAILKNKQQQRNRLQQLALTDIAVMEAKKEGYDKSDTFQFIKKLAERDFTAGYYSKQIREKMSFEDEIVRVSMIRLLVRNYRIDDNKRRQLTQAELEEEFQKKINEARGYIEELNKGASFEKLAQKVSDDYSKKTGGDIGYITRGMRGDEFSDAVFALKEGEFTNEPVRQGNSVFIIKASERVTVNEKNIDKVIKDETKMDGMKRRLMMDSQKTYTEKLRTAEDVVFNQENAAGPNPNAILFKIGDTEFTAGDLNAIVDFIHSRRQSMGQKGNVFDAKIKKDLAEKIFMSELLKREAGKNGVDKDPGFLKEWNHYIDYTLSESYINDTVISGITVTPQEVLKYYNDNRNTLYTSRQNRGRGKIVTNVIPFAKVQDRIRQMLLSQKVRDARNEWTDRIIKEYSFVLHESKLEGKEPEELEKGKEPR